MKSMHAVVLEQPGRLCPLDLADAAPPRPGEALVRIRRVGICGTDLRAFKGIQPYFSYPRILGHELSGVIEQVEPDNPFGLRPGDRCAIEPYLHCGDCAACRRGRTNCCERLQVLGVHADGGMREFLPVPLAKLHKSAQLSFDQLALVEMLSIGAHAARRASLQPDDRALILGAGPIGLATLVFARLAGLDPLVMDVDPARLDFCRQALAARTLRIDSPPAAGSPPAGLREACGGELPTIVFDCTGNPQSMRGAFDDVAHGGRLVFVGLTLESISFQDPLFHAREISLLASRNATAEDFRQVLLALESGRLRPELWITHRATHRAVAEEFPRWIAGGPNFRKALVEW